MKKTKIICTMGPNADNRDTLKQLALHGMDVARFNFSHGDHEEQKGRLELLKSVREELDLPIAALLDTKGPEIRTGLLKDGKVHLQDGMPYTLTTREVEADGEICHVNYAGLPACVKPGTHILIDDGLIDLAVERVENTEIFRAADPQYHAFAGITGYQLYSWYKNHKYCGRCGRKMTHSEKERMLYCGECRNIEYPKICPAVIIGVTDGNRILMSKYAGRAYKKYALLAGFTEIGETVEQTVAREVMEEVGLKVKNIRYYKSQPWAFTDTLLMGFYCDLDGDDGITLDENELAMAEWFEREEIPVEPSRDSLTNEMIIRFKKGAV